MTRENLTDFEREFEKQASRYYNYNGPDDFYAIRECCKELMQKAKEELMKEAVEGEICGDIRNQEEKPYQIWVESDFLPLGEKFEIGDKVRIIVVKED